jgi:hypothetical protein
MLLGVVMLLIAPKSAHQAEHAVFASSQRVELFVVVMVLRDFPQEPINLYSDSHYVVGVLCCIKTAYIGHTSSEELFNLFFQLYSLVQTHFYPYFVSHLHSHSNLPGLLTDSNAWEDNLVSGFTHANSHTHRNCPAKSCFVPSKCFSPA